MAAVLLYGLMTRVRSSRGLEEALEMRIDFRWLAEGRRMDHSTLSDFRHKFGAELKNLFVQVGLLAREMQLLSLSRLAFDGTRIKANNRRSGSRTPEELRNLRNELQQKFEELEQQAAKADAQDQEVYGNGSPQRLPEELADVKRRCRKIDQVLAELKRVEEAGEAVPKRIPLTDPESRITPNKEGGFAPNFTPLAAVDVGSGLIVSNDVIALMNEEQHLIPALEDVQQQFGLEELPAEVLVDGLFPTGENLAALEDRNVTLYSPVPLPDPAKNPALREDPTQPVPEALWKQLPTRMVKPPRGEKRPQLEKSAFVYDSERDCYWCPQGKPMTCCKQTSENRLSGVRIERRRYQAAAADCAECPLKSLCLQKQSKPREITRDQFEEHRERLARRMATPEAQEKYRQRRHPGERPFAVVKQQFGARQFLLRGLKKVRTEWCWLTTAFNLKLLMRHWRGWSGRAPPGLASS